jgi:hypothetical protein
MLRQLTYSVTHTNPQVMILPPSSYERISRHHHDEQSRRKGNKGLFVKEVTLFPSLLEYSIPFVNGLEQMLSICVSP